MSHSHVIEGSIRRDSNSYFFSADRRHYCLHCFDHETSAVPWRPTVCVRTLIGIIGQKLIEQVTTGRVQFHTVASSSYSALRCINKGVTRRNKIVRSHGPRFLERLCTCTREDFSSRRYRTGCNWLRADHVDMANPPSMHQLHEDVSASTMDRISDSLPTSGVFIVMRSGGVWIALTNSGGLYTFGNNETKRGTLGVILRHQIGGHTSRSCSITSHWRHDYSIRSSHGANA
ncbi:unannotated protein [freshwater metagenome]|uniref:Unannotated protein n=1 Tax=freshwater metagenome TaxID=449393 RepID=A0A6J7T1C5_9ZZZZ